MDTKECEDALQFLLKTLEQYKFGWVLDQFNEQVRLGRTEDIEVRVPRASKLYPHDEEGLALFEGSTQRSPKGVLTTLQRTRPYTPCEELELLTESIEQAVVNTTKMANETLQQFDQEMNISEIQFYSEEEATETLILKRHDFLSRIDEADTLKALLTELRKEINAP